MCYQVKFLNLTKFSEGELFQSSAERLKTKQAAFEKMRKKKLKKLEVRIKRPEMEPIILLNPQVMLFNLDP